MVLKSFKPYPIVNRTKKIESPIFKTRGISLPSFLFLKLLSPPGIGKGGALAGPVAQLVRAHP